MAADAHCEYLIVGGGVAGTTASETIRERAPAASIAIVSDEPYPLYSRVLLPNYAKGEASRDQVFLRKTDDYRAKSIMLLAGESARALDARARTLALSSGSTLEFGKLLIASGGRPRPIGIPGEALEGVSRFHTIDDADRLLELLPSVRKAAVLGGGLIALEYLDILAARQIPTTLVIPHHYFFSRFLDAAGGELLAENFRRHGVEVIARERLAAIEGGSRISSVRLQGGRTIEADFLGAGIGLERNTAWLAGSGLALTPGGIAADEFLETSAQGIFAAGDVADFNDLTLGFRHTHGNWGNSFRQGALAGCNMIAPAVKEPYRSVTGYGIRNLGFHIALVGHAAGGPGIRAVTRLDPAIPAYWRFFVKGERLVGASLVNRPEDRSAIATLISERILIPEAGRKLADPKFDIASLLP